MLSKAECQQLLTIINATRFSGADAEDVVNLKAKLEKMAASSDVPDLDLVHQGAGGTA